MSFVFYQGLERSQEDAFDTGLNNYAVDIANATDSTIIGGLVVKREALIDENKVFPFPLGQSFVQIRGLDGFVHLSSRNLGGHRLPISRETMQSLTRGETIFQTVQLPGGYYRMIHYLINRPSVQPVILQVAVPLNMLIEERRQILSLLWILIPLALLTSGLGGLIVATRALGPMKNIIASARAIQPHELSARIQIPDETETKDLALTLNDLLARLQKAFESQEQFIADASHQLKTPLAIMRGELDVFLKSHHSLLQQEAPAQLLSSFSQEINQLAKVVDDLLLLARFDSGGFTPSFARVRIDEILFEAIGKLNRLAKSAGVEIDFVVETPTEQAADFEIRGDFDLLHGLFYNLIENSIKYSPKPGQTTVRLASENNEIRVDVKDRGPGISEEEKKRIFDRFYRGGQSQHKVPGVGLGLSIASRIAKFHGAELTVQSVLNQGTTFTFRIKRF